MNTTENILLQLTGRALFNAPTEFDAAAVDWQALYEESLNQTLSLLIWDVLTDEERTALPGDMASTWEQNALRIIMGNEQLLYEQDRVIRLLEDNGIPLVILKGSSSAVCYPDPSLRTMGDIDILVRPGQQLAAVALLRENGYEAESDPEDSVNHCHIAVCKNNIAVEVHKEPNGLYMSSNAEISQVLQSLFEDAVDKRQIEDGLPVLADDKQAVVLILHKLEHFTTSGLGMRQLCDWAAFVNKKLDMTTHDGRELWDNLEPLLSDVGLLTFTGVMTRVCVEYLHLPEEKARWAMQYDGETARRVMEQILREGNFGRKAEKYAERLFSNPNSSNRITSFIRVMCNVCREHWPPCDRHIVLMPIAPFVLLRRYLVQRSRGERPKLNLKKKYRQAEYDQKLYKELKPFMVE
ncbi:MAG: nucleotidyltransferase family protein [Clostridiales bacterium]|nr:nucleotidyltransferase family protein [Clostridiales bacterium]